MRFVMARSLLTYLRLIMKLTKIQVTGHVQLEELHLTWLSGIDYFVEGTRRESRYLGQLCISRKRNNIRDGVPFG
jgi:hypothetical protein